MAYKKMITNIEKKLPLGEKYHMNKGGFNRIARFTAISFVVLTLLSLTFLWPGISQENSSNPSEEGNDSLLNENVNESISHPGSDESSAESGTSLIEDNSATQGEVDGSQIVAQLDISTCGVTLTSTNEIYDITKNIDANETCITISANNITLNGGGFTINYSRGNNGFGILVNGANNTRINNVIIQTTTSDPVGADGISVSKAANTTISNVTILAKGSASSGIAFEGSTNFGNNLITGAVINTSGLTAEGIDNNAVGNFTVSHSRILCLSSIVACVDVCDSDSNGTFTNITVTVNGTSASAFKSTGGVCQVSDSVFNASTAGSNDTSLSGSGITNFTNVTLLNNKIQFANTARLNVHWHFDVLVNSTNKSNIASANVTAWNVSNGFSFSELTNASGRLVRRAMLEYSKNATSTAYQNNYTFNVTAGGHLRLSRSVNISGNRNEVFTLKEVNLTSCQTLDETNTTYLLTKSVTATSTCMTITATNVTLDGQGNKINYGSDGNDNAYGIYTSNANYTTLKNLIVEDGEEAPGDDTYAIFFTNSSNNTVQNNTIITLGDDNAFGIYFFSTVHCNSNQITNNNISARGSYGVGIFLDGNCDYNRIAFNNINTTGSDGYGIYLQNDNDDNNISWNNITTTGTSGHGIAYYFFTSNQSRNVMQNNIIATNGTSAGGIVSVIGGSNDYNNMSRNNITLRGSTAQGISLSIPFGNLSSNTIVAYGTGSTGMSMSGQNFSSFNATIFMYGTNSGGIDLKSDKDIFFYLTTILANNSGSYGINPQSGRSYFYDSVINASHLSSNDTLMASSGNLSLYNVTLANNRIAFKSGADGRLEKYWYMDVFTNYTNGTAAVNANITARNVSGNFAFSRRTNSTGRIPRQNVLEYWRNASLTREQNNYTVNASLPSENLTQSWNMSTNRFLTFTFASDIALPNISFVAPTPANGIITDNTTIQVNVSVGENALSEFIWNWNGTNYSFYDSNLDLMFNFDNVSALGENSSLVVDVGNSPTNGTVAGAFFNSSGKYGGAYQFSSGSSDVINVTTYTSVPNSAFTLSAWVYQSSNPTYDAKIINMESQTLTYNELIYDTATDKVKCIVTEDGPAYNTVYSATTLPNNEWVYVACAGSSSNLSIYINGEISDSAAPSASPINTLGSSLQIGNNRAGDRAWTGLIDEVRIYTTILSGESIRQHYYSNLYKYGANSWSFITNQSNLSLGNYTFFASALDTGNNRNTTETRTITVADTIAPLVTVNQPTGNFTISSVTFNATLNENGICRYTLNSGINNVTMQNNGNRDFNHTNSSIGDGSYIARFYCNDTSNNLNSSVTRAFIVDTTRPGVTLVHPQNITYATNTSLSLNSSVSDTNLQACWYAVDGGSNITLTCGQNTTLNVSQGSHTVRVYANDSVGNVNGSSSVTFFADSIFPLVSYASNADADGLNVSRNWIFVNVSVTETNFANITFRLYNTTSNVNTTTFSTQTFSLNFTSLSDGFYTFNVTVMDSASNSNTTATRGMRVDTTLPLVSYGTGTENDGTNFTRNWIFVNVSVTETNFANITFRLFNGDNALVNSTTLTTQIFSLNFTSLSDGLYRYNITVSDGANNRNTTATRVQRLDNNGPAVKITEPKAQTYSTNVSLALNFTSSDAGIGMQACFWNLDDGANTTITCGTNTTFNTSEGSHTVRVYANDTLGNLNLSTVIFSVSLAAPSVQLTSPSDGQWLNYALNVYFNYTPTDADGISMCRLYGNWTGSFSVNQTNTSLANATNNFFAVNFTGYADASFLWSVECNDTSNNRAFALNNFTVGIDTTNPLLEYGVGSDADGLNVSRNWIFVNVSVTEVNFANITFRLYNSTGNFNTTTFTTRNFSLNFTSLSDGFYTFNVTVVDSASNSNTTAIRGVRVNADIPSATIVEPQNISYATNVSFSLNYTVSDSLLQNCWWALDGGSNTTLTCGQNTTFNASQGSHTARVYANDSAGNVNGSSFVVFFVDSVFPLISYGEGSENDGGNVSRNWIFVNVSVTEVNFANITFSLFNASQGEVNATVYTSQIFFINFTSLSDGTYYYNVSITDTLNNRNATSTRRITLDTTNPNATLVSPGNGTFNTTATQNLTVNLSDNIELRNATLFVYNASDALVNQTVSAFSAGTQRLLGVVYTFVYDGIFRWFFRVVDLAGNFFVTGNNTITIDTLNPALFANNFSTPNGTAGIVHNTGNPVVKFFVNATDTNLQWVVLEINYTTVHQNLTRLTTPNVQQIGDRFEVSFQAGQGIDNRENISWRWYVNDSAGNRNSTSFQSFLVANRAPEKPTFNLSNNSFIVAGNISLRIDAFDPDNDNLSFFVYNGTNGTFFALYYTANATNFTTFNFTGLSEGRHYLYATVNDSRIQSDALFNISDTLLLTVDTINPGILSITSPSATSAICSLSGISLTYTANDTNLDYCVFNVTNASNADDIVISDTTLSGCGSATFSVSGNGNYTLGLRVYDKAGSLNSTIRNFTVNTAASSCSSQSPGSGGSPGGGGGGGAPSNRTRSRQQQEAQQEGLIIQSIGEVIMSAGESKALSATVTYEGNRSILNNCKLSGEGEYASWISPSRKEEDITRGEIVEYPFTLRAPRDIGPGAFDLGLKVKCLEIESVSAFLVSILERDLLIELMNVNKSGNLLELTYRVTSNSPEVRSVNVEYWLSDQSGVNLTRGDDYIELEPGTPVTRRVVLDVHAIRAGEYLLHIVGSSELAVFVIEEPVLIPRAGTGLGQIILAESPGTLAFAFILISSFIIFSFIIIRRIIIRHRIMHHHARGQRGVVKIKVR